MRAQRRRFPPAWAVISVSTLAVLAVVVFNGAKPVEYRHPHPRPGVAADSVVPDFLLGGFPQSRPAYAVARGVPALLDGLRCYCNCAASIGHRSLLSCFEDLHGAACDICQREAVLAAEHWARGEPLEAVRTAVDATYGPPGS